MRLGCPPQGASPPAPTRRTTLAGLAGLATAAAQPSLGGPAEVRAVPRPRSMTYEVLEVGPGKAFPSLTRAGEYMVSSSGWNNGYDGADAVSRRGFRIIISPGPPGYYSNDSGSYSRRWTSPQGWPPYHGNLLGPVVVEGESGKPAPVLDTDGAGDGVLYYQTGLFATGDFDAVFRRLVFRDFRRNDGYGNYAAIRLGQSFFDRPLSNIIRIEDCEFSGCDNGILGGRPGQKVVLRGCHFHDNGGSTGMVHNIYVGDVAELTVDGVLSTRCTIGHLLKSRAARTIIRDSQLIGGGGTESACLDVPNGGVLDIDGLVCEKSPGSDAIWLIHYAGENQDRAGMRFHDPSGITIRNLLLIAPPTLLRHPDAGPVRGFVNQSGDGAAVSGEGSRQIPVDARDVQAHGLTPATAGLPCRILPFRPVVPPIGMALTSDA